jgi:hypothetical protein
VKSWSRPGSKSIGEVSSPRSCNPGCIDGTTMLISGGQRGACQV